MVRTSTTSSSSSSTASFGSFDGQTVQPTTPTSIVKLICSYGGKILPRHNQLRYVGGETRMLTVDRNIPFPELQAKLGELCGLGPLSLRCQLPTDDLDALVSVTSDEDLANLYEEYELAQDILKIRAFLFPPRTLSPKPLVTESCTNTLSVLSQLSMERTPGYPNPGGHYDCPAYSLSTPQYLLHYGNHWQ